MDEQNKPVDLGKIKLYPIKDRKSIVYSKDFARADPGDSFASLLNCVPDILAGRDMRDASTAILTAGDKDKPIMWAFGAHFIKCGLSPLLIDLMDKDMVSSVSLNGGGMIHDTELCLFGQTSEDVACELPCGRFGFARETGDFINGAVSRGRVNGLGLGESVGRALLEAKADFQDISIIANCVDKGIPVTVHVAVGTDIIHTHSSFNPSETAEASHLDFRVYAGKVAELGGGGVYLNVGSAVLLPEVFLKAVSVANNLGGPLSDFTCINLDFNRQYRALENVLKRPGGKPISITGHHELTFPLLYKMLVQGVL